MKKLGSVHIVSNEPLYSVDDVAIAVLPPRFKNPRILAESFYNLQYDPVLTRQTRLFQPDAIYHRFSGFSYATASVARRLNLPMILEYNSSDLWTMKYWENQALYRLLTLPFRAKMLEHIEQYNLDRAAVIVTLSTVLRDTLVRDGVSADRILVNPNGVDPEQFKPLNDAASDLIRQKWSIPDERVVIGYSGTFGEWHGIPELAEGIWRLNQESAYRSRLFFILFGDGKLRPNIQKRIGQFENVRFTGVIPFNDIAGQLSICDILLSPHGKTPDGKPFFGSPTKLFEYMAMAKGIVASNLDQLGEVITHQRNGLLIEPGNIDELVTAIKTLADNADLRTTLGKVAREDVIARYTWTAHVERTVDALQTLQSADGKKH